MKTIAKLSAISLFVLLGLTFLLIYVTNRYVLTINFYENSGDPVAGFPDEEGRVYQELQKWIYLSSLAYLLVKLLCISLILYTGLYLAEHPVSFGKIFLVCILADSIFLIAAAAKLIWFHVYYPQGTLSDWHRIYMLSAISVFDAVPADWSYALQTLNAFEMAYWFILAFGIYRISGLDFDRSLQVVVKSYLPCLFVWVTTITFLTVVMFPTTG